MASITPYQTKAGKRWRVRYRKPDRSQTDKRGFRTKRDAEVFAATVEVSKHTGTYIDPTAGRVTIDGVDLRTSILPAGWRERLVRVSNTNTTAPGGEPQFTGWCLNKEDLCVAKLCALREKDRNFVAALVDAGLVDPDIVLDRLDTVEPAHTRAASSGRRWLIALRSRPDTPPRRP